MAKPGTARIAVALAVAALLVGAPARANEVWDSFARSVGLAPSEPNPPDFVKQSRPDSPPAPLPAFAAPDEPPSRVKSSAELKAMDTELTQEGAKHDALRAAFPPSAKAVADARRAQQAKEARRRKPAAKPVHDQAF